MSKTKIAAVVTVLIMVCAAVAAFAIGNDSQNDGSDETVTVTQVDGVEKTVRRMPERVVCLSTYACEMLMIFGCTDRVVGVTNSSYENADQSKHYSHAKDLGDFNNPDNASLVKLNPDLIITWSTQRDVNASFDQLNLPYVKLQCSSYETMETEVTSLGKIFGKEDTAAEYCAFFSGIVDKVESAADRQDAKKRVFMESFSSYKASGSTSSYYRLAVRAGADMVYTEKSTATISAAWLAEKNPEIIIKTPMLYKMINGGAKAIHDEICSREGFKTTAAVMNDNVYVLCSQLFGGPRCFAGMVACYEMLYGGGELTLSSVLNDYNEKFGLSLSTSDLAYPSI